MLFKPARAAPIAPNLPLEKFPLFYLAVGASTFVGLRQGLASGLCLAAVLGVLSCRLVRKMPELPSTRKYRNVYGSYVVMFAGFFALYALTWWGYVYVAEMTGAPWIGVAARCGAAYSLAAGITGFTMVLVGTFRVSRHPVDEV